MTTKIIVIKTTDCPDCLGTGTVYRGIWNQYWEEHPNPSVDELGIAYWFHCNGWDEVPSEEMPCLKCKGAGQLRTEVNLLTILSDLADLGYITINRLALRGSHYDT